MEPVVARVEIDDGDLEEGIVDVAIGDEGDAVADWCRSIGLIRPDGDAVWRKSRRSCAASAYGIWPGWRDSNPRPLRAERNRLTLQVSNGTD